MNLDLNRLARSTSAGSVQGSRASDARDVRAAVERLLAHSRAERIITCSPADYLAFKAYSGRETLLHHGVPAVTEIKTDVLIIGASLAGAAAAKRTVDAGFQHDHPRAQDAAAPQDLLRHPLAARLRVPARELRRAARRGVPRAEVGDRRQLPVPERPAAADAVHARADAAHLPQARRSPRRESSAARRCTSTPSSAASRPARTTSSSRRAGCRRTARRSSTARSTSIAADGPRSEVVAKLYPSFRDSIYWFVVGQKYYKADLEPRRAVVPLHDQLAARLLHLDARRERLSHRRLHRRARRAVAEGAREGPRLLPAAPRPADPRGSVEGGLHRELRHVADQQLRVRRAAGAGHRPGGRAS